MIKYRPISVLLSCSIVCLIFSIAYLTTGCSSKQAAANIRKVFPNDEIALLPGEKYAFIVRTSNNEIWYVVCQGTGSTVNDTDIYKYLLFTGRTNISVIYYQVEEKEKH